jgi:hypothetical protein
MTNITERQTPKTVDAPNCLDIKLPPCQSARSFDSKSETPLSDHNAMTSQEPEQKEPVLLPSIGLIDRHGSAYPVSDPGSLPEAWSWAQPALQKLGKELAPTGNQAIDSLRNKLLRIFAQNNGQIVFTEGPLRHALLYPVRDTDNGPKLSDPGFLRAAFKAALWVVEKTLNRSLAIVTGGFSARYDSGQPSFRIAFATSSYVATEDLIRTHLIEQRPPEHNGIENIRLASPLMHELAHAAVEAGHLLSGMDRRSSMNKGFLLAKAANKERITNTSVFSLLKLMDSAQFNAIPAVVNTLPYQDWQQPEENLAYAVANYCGEAGQTPSPFLERFIAGILNQDLDLILAGDRQGRQGLLDALTEDSDLYRDVMKCFADSYGEEASVKSGLKTLQDKITETISAAMSRLRPDDASPVKVVDSQTIFQPATPFQNGPP